MKDSSSVAEKIINNKELIFSILFYAAGLILAALIFTSDSDVNQAIKAFLEYKTNSLKLIIISRIISYSIIYIIIVLLSFSVIGYPFIIFLPLLLGLIIGLKLAYLYSGASNGIINCLLTVIPEAALLMSLIVFSVKNAFKLSKCFYYSSVKKPDDMLDFDIKAYIRLYIVYFVFIDFIAVINSLLIWFAGTYIKL